MDCRLPGSSAHGIFQAIVLEWVAIAFSVTNLDRILKAETPFFVAKGPNVWFFQWSYMNVTV